MAMVQRFQGICDAAQQPCPAVHKLMTGADLDRLLGRHELTAIAVVRATICWPPFRCTPAAAPRQEHGPAVAS